MLGLYCEQEPCRGGVGAGCVLILHACHTTGAQGIVTEEMSIEAPAQAWTILDSLHFCLEALEGLSSPYM